MPDDPRGEHRQAEGAAPLAAELQAALGPGDLRICRGNWQAVDGFHRDGIGGRAGRHKLDDGFLRETFTLPRDKARTRARDFLNRYPKAAYMSGVESWRELPGGDIEFTMRRLPSAD